MRKRERHYRTVLALYALRYEEELQAGYELEFWSEVNQERIRVVFPVSFFEDEAQEEDKLEKNE